MRFRAFLFFRVWRAIIHVFSNKYSLLERYFMARSVPLSGGRHESTPCTVRRGRPDPSPGLRRRRRRQHARHESHRRRRGPLRGRGGRSGPGRGDGLPAHDPPGGRSHGQHPPHRVPGAQKARAGAGAGPDLQRRPGGPRAHLRAQPEPLLRRPAVQRAHRHFELFQRRGGHAARGISHGHVADGPEQPVGPHQLLDLSSGGHPGPGHHRRQCPLHRNHPDHFQGWRRRQHDDRHQHADPDPGGVHPGPHPG